MKQLIKNELKIWKTSYPKEAKVLEKFANKIYFELRYNFIDANKLKEKLPSRLWDAEKSKVMVHKIIDNLREL